MGISPTEGSGVTLGECDCTAMGGGVERGRLELELNFVNRFSTDFFNGTCTYTNNEQQHSHIIIMQNTHIQYSKIHKKHSKTTLKALEMHNTHTCTCIRRTCTLYMHAFIHIMLLYNVQYDIVYIWTRTCTCTCTCIHVILHNIAKKYYMCTYVSGRRCGVS